MRVHVGTVTATGGHKPFASSVAPCCPLSARPSELHTIAVVLVAVAVARARTHACHLLWQAADMMPPRARVHYELDQIVRIARAVVFDTALVALWSIHTRRGAVAMVTATCTCAGRGGGAQSANGEAM